MWFSDYLPVNEKVVCACVCVCVCVCVCAEEGETLRAYL